MLAIRLQRTGRSGHAQYRMIVQDARKSPTSGKIVTSLGSYNPHTKSLVIDKEKAGLFLKNGAQPSSRVISLLAKDGVKIPDWAQKLAKKERAIKNTDKLRKNRPADAEAVADKPVVAEAMTDKPAGEAASAPVETESAEPVETVDAVAEEPAIVDEVPAEVVAPEATVAEEVAPEVVGSAEVVTDEVVPTEEVAEATDEPAVAEALADEPKPKA